MTCNRCNVEIEDGREEFCCWCTSPLCYECWDEYGHCGHEEADLVNEEARKVEQL